MQKKIFITQNKLDSWSADKKIELDGETLTILSPEKPTYKLTPAVKFLSIDSQANDPHGLVGKILPAQMLAEKEVEVYMGSAIYKDDAYKVEEGFTGDLVEAAAAPPPPPEPAESEKVKSDDELLADFFLKNL